MSPIRIAIVLPMYNAAASIAAVLAPIVAMRERGEVDDLILVDDASDDDTAAIAHTHSGVLPIRRSARGGPGAARNDGVQAAHADYVWFVDSDVVVAEDAARVLRNVLSRERPAAVFGSYDDAPAGTNFLSQYKNLVHAYYHRRAERVSSTFWAGCGAVERAAFIAVGGFDASRYPESSIEDIELGYRLRAAGGSIICEPALRGKHLKIWRLGNLLATDIFRRAIPWATLMLERGALTDDLNVSRGERVRAAIAGACAVAILLAVTGTVPSWIAAALAVLAIAVNRPLIAFFKVRLGIVFALTAFLYHQVQYLYSSAAFLAAYVRHRMRSCRIPGR